MVKDHVFPLSKWVTHTLFKLELYSLQTLDGSFACKCRGDTKLTKAKVMPTITKGRV
jgi:hypothetical protein